MDLNQVSRRRIMQLLATTMAGSVFTNDIAAEVAGFATGRFDQQGPAPVFLAPGAGRKGKIGSSDIIFKLDKQQTSGSLGSSEFYLPPGILGAPPHHHKNFDEVCIVQEGAVHIWIAGEVVEVKAGGWHLRPRGSLHTFWNSGKIPAKFIELYLPGGHEEYMSDLATLFENNQKPKPGELAQLASKYDIIFAFDKLQPIMDEFKVHL